LCRSIIEAELADCYDFSVSDDFIVIAVTACNGVFRLLKSATADGGNEHESTQLVDVSFDVEWNAIAGCFDFDVDLPTNVLCDAAAREPWTREFFKTLRAYVSCQALSSF